MADSDTINLDEINDVSFLQNLLDQTEDIDDRKAIRARIQEIRAAEKAKREEKLNRLTNTREEMLREKQKKAEEHKSRTLQMYDQMAKSAPAGGDKRMDIGFYKSLDGTPPSSGSSTPTGSGRKDLVEDAIKQRQREADERKKRILFAYDSAAKTQPAGTAREINFEAFKRADAPTSQPTTPVSPGMSGPNFPQLDPVERAIRERQKEAEDRKKRILAAYDIVAKQGPGPKSNVILEEFRDLNDTNTNARAKFEALDTTSGMSKPVKTNFSSGGGVARSPTDIKDMLLRWSRAKTKGYEHVEINNFSSSWANGMAFCALIHHFYPDSFDYSSLDPSNRKTNFELAFKTAEEKADISPLLDPEDMILMRDKPDWKCVFTYVQSIYRKLHALS